MATITEDYVPFETAKLLKEKGFDEECRSYYFDNGKDYTISFTKLLKYDMDDDEILRPTLQMAMKWLREVHKIFIEIGTSIDLNGDYHHNYSILDKECKYIRKGYTSFDWNYVDACEAAIKYCLENLI